MIGRLFRNLIALEGSGRAIETQARKEKNIIYGQQSVARQIGVFARPTNDYDVMSRRPRQSARRIEQVLDKRSGSDEFYTEQSQRTRGVWKVYNKGPDHRARTRDDVHIADYSKIRSIPTVVIGGVRYAALSSTVRDKRRALADPQYSFRHAKDLADVRSIQQAQFFRRPQ